MWSCVAAQTLRKKAPKTNHPYCAISPAVRRRYGSCRLYRSLYRHVGRTHVAPSRVIPAIYCHHISRKTRLLSLDLWSV